MPERIIDLGRSTLPGTKHILFPAGTVEDDNPSIQTPPEKVFGPPNIPKTPSQEVFGCPG